MIRIYIDRKAIEKSNETGRPVAPIMVDRDGVIEHAHDVGINGPSRLVYSPRVTHNGAHVWIETDAPVTTG